MSSARPRQKVADTCPQRSIQFTCLISQLPQCDRTKDMDHGMFPTWTSSETSYAKWPNWYKAFVLSLDYIKGTAWTESEKGLKGSGMQSLTQGEISTVAWEWNAPMSNPRERKHRAILWFYVEDKDDKSRYFRDLDLHEAFDMLAETLWLRRPFPSIYFPATNKHLRSKKVQAVDFGSS